MAASTAFQSTAGVDAGAAVDEDGAAFGPDEPPRLQPVDRTAVARRAAASTATERRRRISGMGISPAEHL
jgi:hypothetical protein